MLAVNDYISYGATGICKVIKIVERPFGKEIKNFYVLKPVSQNASTIFVPVDNEILVNKMKKLLSKDEITEVIESVEGHDDIWIENDAERKECFSKIVSSGDRKKLMLLVRSVYNRQIKLKEKGKKLHISDERFFNDAERLIREEFSIVLGIEPDGVVSYISQKFNG